LATSDSLDKYLSFKSSYENLGIKVLQICLPKGLIEEAKKNLQKAENDIKEFTNKILELNRKISVSENNLKKVDPDYIKKLNTKTIGIGLFLCLGEMTVTTQVYQVTNDNTLVSIIFSFCVSASVTLGAHFAARLYKDSKSILKRRLIILASAIGIFSVSIVIAHLRNTYFQKVGITNINAMYFTIFNIVLFIVGAISTWYLYPPKEVLDEYKENIQNQLHYEKLIKERNDLEYAKRQYEIEADKKNKIITESLEVTEYALRRVRILFKESVDTYISANRQGRNDLSDCYDDKLPELNFTT
jgi:hypothetical protein